MPLKAVFFDIDGTLVESNGFHVLAWAEAFHHHGLDFDHDKIRTQIGKGADQLIPSLVPDLDEDTQKAVADRHGKIFRLRYLQEVEPLAGASDLIKILNAKGKQIILASSAEKAEVQHYVDLLKIEPMLTGTISTDDVANSKPAGDIFAAALAQVFPLAASETLAVGDTPYDVEAALHSNVKTVAVRSGGFSGQSLAEAGAPYIYASVNDLLENFDASPLNG